MPQATQHSETAAPLTLTRVHFGRDWIRAPGAARVLHDTIPQRALGTATAITPAGQTLTGVLVRRSHDHSFVLSADQLYPLPRTPTRKFLQKLRSGFHGGPGRAQGSLSKDHVPYTRCRSINLTNDDIVAAVQHGNGILSVGLRALARTLAQHESQHPGFLAALPHTTRRLPQLVHLRAYLDPTSESLFRSIGHGGLSRGIRAGSRALSAITE